MSDRTEKGAGLLGAWTSPTTVISLLVALAVPLYFVKLGGAALVDPDEPYYAVPALEMLKSGVWSVPIFRGQPWFDKPILYYWMILGAFKAFGVSEWSARVGSAAAGLLGAVALALMAPRGWRRNGSNVLAAIVLATSLEYAFLARSAVTDATLTLFLTLGYLAVALYLESGSVLSAASAGAAFGLATLTKGPVGVVVPAIGIVGYGWATRRRELLAPKALAASAVAFAAMAVPWYGYMIAAHRDLVVKVFLGEENLGRFVSPEHQQFPLFYVAVLAVGLLPWSAALPAGLWRSLRALWNGDERGGALPGTVFALAWFASVFGVFSLSASKLLTYILPAFPAAAYLIADYWCDAFAPSPAGTRAARGPFVVAWTGALISILAAVVILKLLRGGRYAGAGPALYALAALLAAAGLAAVAAVRSRKLMLFAGVQAASTIGIVLTFVVYAWPGLEASESTKTLVRRLEAGGMQDQVAGAYHVPDVSLEFYLGRALTRENDAGGLEQRVRSEPDQLWVVRADEVEALRSGLPLRVEPVMTVSRRAVVRLSPGAPGAGGEDRP